MISAHRLLSTGQDFTGSSMAKGSAGREVRAPTKGMIRNKKSQASRRLLAAERSSRGLRAEACCMRLLLAFAQAARLKDHFPTATGCGEVIADSVPDRLSLR